MFSKLNSIRVFCFTAVALTNVLSVSSESLNGSLVKLKQVKAQAVKVKPKAVTSGNTPHYHVDFTPANKSSKRFDSFQSSIPDKATKTYLHKIKAEPNSLAGIMSTPEGQATSANKSASTAFGTTSDTGSTPRVLTPSGVAIPQSGGTSSTFFK